MFVRPEGSKKYFGFVHGFVPPTVIFFPKSKEISYPYAAFACQMGLIPPSDTIDSLKHLGIL